MRNENGSVLIQVLVLGAVITTIATYVMDISQNSLIVSKHRRRQSMNSTTTSLIKTLFLNPYQCRNSLDDVAINAPDNRFTELKDTINNFVLSADDYASKELKNIAGFRVVGKTNKDGKRYSFDEIPNSFSPNPISSGDIGTGEITLVVEFKRGKDKITREYIPIYAEVDDSYDIQDCFAISYDIDTVFSETCRMFGASADPIGYKCISPPAIEPIVFSNYTIASTKFVDDYFGNQFDSLFLKADGSNSQEANLTITESLKASSFAISSDTNEEVTTPSKQECGGKQLSQGTHLLKTACSKDLSCNSGENLRGVTKNGSPVCLKVKGESCKSNEYISEISADGSITCTKRSNTTVTKCPNNELFTSIELLGAISSYRCRVYIVPDSCSKGKSVYGFSSTGKILCK